MFGPGEYVPDSTAGITDVKDLLSPQIAAYSRNHAHTPCPRCGHRSYRHKDQRTLPDLTRRPTRSERNRLLHITRGLPQWRKLRQWVNRCT